MKSFGLIIALILLFLTANSFANRATSFDDRDACYESKGVWRQFNNGCVDKCISKFNKFSICNRAITYGCDCGKGRCWEDGACMQISDYEKIYNTQQEVEKKELEEAKKRRHDDFVEHREKFLSKLYEEKNAASQGRAYNSDGTTIAPSNNFADIYKKNSPAPQIIVEQNPNSQNQVIQVQQPVQQIQQPIIVQPVPGQIIAAPTQSIVEAKPTPYFLIQQEELQKAQEDKKKTEQKKTPNSSSVLDPSIPSLPTIPLPN